MVIFVCCDLFVEFKMSSVVLQSNKGKENQNSKNVQLKSKNSRENIDGTTGRPGARRRFGEYVYRFLRKLLKNEKSVVFACQLERSLCS